VISSAVARSIASIAARAVGCSRSARLGGSPAAEVLEVRDGVTVRGELIYDAEELRRRCGRLPADLAEERLGGGVERVDQLDA
jgi:hypothetical protein